MTLHVFGVLCHQALVSRYLEPRVYLILEQLKSAMTRFTVTAAGPPRPAARHKFAHRTRTNRLFVWEILRLNDPLRSALFRTRILGLEPCGWTPRSRRFAPDGYIPTVIMHRHNVFIPGNCAAHEETLYLEDPGAMVEQYERRAGREADVSRCIDSSLSSCSSSSSFTPLGRPRQGGSLKPARTMATTGMGSIRMTDSRTHLSRTRRPPGHRH